MSTSKHFDRICVIVTIAAVLLTVLFMNGTSLGLTAVVDEDAENYTGDENFTANDLNGSWADTIATSLLTRITLTGDAAKVSGAGAYYNDGQVVIKNGGYYILSGELTDGSIVVDTYKTSKVWILLDGVLVTSSDGSPFVVEQADKVFLTLKEGTESVLTDSASYSEENIDAGIKAALFSREDLTINGSGSLTVNGNYYHGIVCKDDLVIAGGTITVTAVKDGLHANDSICFTGMDLTITAGDDAAHCDTRIYYLDGTLLITTCYEGLEAPRIEILGGDLTIHATDDGINANGGSDSFGMGGGMGMGGRMVNQKFEDFRAQQGEESMSESSENSENTEDAEDAEDLPTVTISGGTITIINENGNDADGIDSNGDVIINGGAVLVSLNNNGGNNALDYGSENGGQLLINSGTVVAAGSSSMLEEVSEESAQCSITYVLSEEAEAGTVVTVTSADGKELISQEIPCAFTAVILSDPQLVQGETYYVTLGDDTDMAEEVTLDSVATSIGTGAGGFGMMGGGMGGGMRGGQTRDGVEMPSDGQMPQPGDENMEAMSEGEAGGQSPGMGQMPGDGQMPDMGQMPQPGAENTEAMSEDEAGSQFPGMGQMPGDGQRPDMGQMPGDPGMEQQGNVETQAQEDDGKAALSEFGSDTWLLFGLSVLALAAGIVFAAVYRRRSAG